MDDSGPLLIDTGRGFSVLYKGRHLYSSTDPVKRTVLRSNQVTFQKDTLYILSSPLLFYGVEELITRIPESSFLICFEYSDILFNFSKKYIPDKLSRKTLWTFIDSTDPQKIIDTVKKLGIWKFRRVKTLSFTGGYSLHSAEYKKIINRVDLVIQDYWKNRMTLIHMAPLWVKNIFSNLYRVNKNNLALKNHPHTDYPILVTGAGESLEKSIAFINENRKFIKILAVDTSISVLMENGIKPDFIIAVDAQIYNFYDFIQAKNEGIPLFFDLTGYPGIPEVVKGQIYPFISDFAHTNLLKRLEKYRLLPEKLPALGSVGLTAIYLSLKITTNRVYFSGLDFSYKIGKSHANGSPRHISELIKTNRVNPMEQPGIYYNRPIIHKKDKTNANCITDLILDSYANLMKDNFGNNNRLFDIGTSGLDCGGEMLQSADILFLNHKDLTQNLSKSESYNIEKDNFTDFVNNELKILRNLYDTVYNYLSANLKNIKELIDLLEEADYVYMHFPDKSPHPAIEPEYLKRILVSCAHYISILKRYT